MPPAVAYYRVSTKQGQSGLGLEAQRHAVTVFARSRNLDVIQEVIEIETETAKRDRPQLRAALETARQAGATLVIAKLDRLARNVAFISSLMEARTPFVACDMPDATELTVHIMAALAEHEARLIGTRTRDALAAAKARGAKLGSPLPMSETCREAGRATTARKARLAYTSLNGYIRLMRQTGMSLREIAAQLNAEGHRSRNGQSWNHAQVARVLKYFAA
ncbi:recombinase family protein [Deinococcus humi]|uniref:DNA invertase Pin-like site-specific DNA recombinase n=1 Tax=Deinococcus humi TaxID=662880 RepID=A0A7W8NHW4_9DEIO|nr:recombinase family protein [Deinococcus humi]MBB5366315.1 DNA invertase Pin-like site-specific DNA recombinase [Deinococcus humi]GGO33609.1 resolvase [Deinococcus humi]